MNKFNTEERAEKLSLHNGLDMDNTYAPYTKLHYGNTMPDSRILVFLTGFCIGMVFFYFSQGTILNTGDSVVGFLDREYLTLLQGFEANQTELFGYVFCLRIKQLLFCTIGALSSIGGLLAYSVIGWYGFETGFLIFSLVYEYGIKGIFLMFSMFLPHGICYLIVFMILFNKFWANDTKCYHKQKTVTEDRRFRIVETVKKAAIILAVFGVGLLCEIYINPAIVRKMAMFF